MVICVERCADLHMAQLMPLPLNVSSVKSRLVLPSWYRLARVVKDKGPLNGCVCVLVCTLFYWHLREHLCTEKLCFSRIHSAVSLQVLVFGVKPLLKNLAYLRHPR